MLDYYIGFNWWKTACIIHGVYARYCAGKKTNVDADLDNLRCRIGRALDDAETALAPLR